MVIVGVAVRGEGAGYGGYSGKPKKNDAIDEMEMISLSSLTFTHQFIIFKTLSSTGLKCMIM